MKCGQPSDVTHRRFDHPDQCLPPPPNPPPPRTRLPQGPHLPQHILGPPALLLPPGGGHHAVGALFVAAVDDVDPRGERRVAARGGDVLLDVDLVGGADLGGGGAWCGAVVWCGGLGGV